jgi:hypothetical protein
MMGTIDLGNDNGLGLNVGNSDEGANEVMMGAIDLGDENGLDVNVGNSCGVVGKFVNLLEIEPMIQIP